MSRKFLIALCVILTAGCASVPPKEARAKPCFLMEEVMAGVYKKTNNVWIPKTEFYWKRTLTGEEKEKYRQGMLEIWMYFFHQNSIPVVRLPEECATGIVKSSSVQ